MNMRMKSLVGALVIACGVTLFSVYLVNFSKHSHSNSAAGDNLNKNWDEYYLSVNLALDALQARHDGRTNDLEILLSEDFFDETLKKAILHYDKNGNQAEANKMLKVYIYLSIVNEAAAPRPPDNTPHDAQMIDLFRKIAAIQPSISYISIDPEVEASVTRYIEESINKYEEFASQLSANGRQDSEQRTSRNDN